MKRLPRWPQALGLLLILGLAFGVRVWGAGQTSSGSLALGYAGDASLALATRSLGEILVAHQYDVHPPLFFWLLHFWIAAAGKTAFAAKFLPLLLSVLSVALIYQVGRLLSRPSIGILAAALLALSSLHLESTMDVRGYIPALCFVLISLYTFWRLCLDPAEALLARKRWGLWAGYVLATTAALYTSYFAVAAFLAQLSFLLLFRRHLGRPRPLFLAMGVTALSYAPWVLAVASAIHSQLPATVAERSTGVSWPLVPQFLARTLFIFTTNRFVEPGYFWLLALYGLLLLALFLGRRRGTAPSPGEGSPALSGLWVFLLLLGLSYGLLLGYVASYLWDRGEVGSRFLIIPLAFFLPGLAWALDRVREQRAPLLPLFLLAFAAIFLASTQHLLSVPPPPPDLWSPEEVTSYLQGRAGPQDGILFMNLGQAGYYESLVREPRSWYYILHYPTIMFNPDITDQVQRVLPAAVAKHPVLWVVLYPGPYARSRPVLRWLNQHAYPAEHESLSDSQIFAYVRPQGPLREEPLDISFAEGLRLRSVRYTPAARPEGAVPLTLEWQAQRPVNGRYKVFVHLLDAQGRRWAQHDAEPQNGEAPISSWQPQQPVSDHHGLLLPPDLPAGEYRVVVGLYSEAGRLKTTDGRDQVEVAQITVGTVSRAEAR